MYYQGKTFTEISSCTGLASRGARKICDHYGSTGTLNAVTKCGSGRSILTNNVVQHIEYYKSFKPSTYNREIRENLIVEEVCTEENTPSLSSISKSIRNDLGYTYKKISCIPKEKERHLHRQDEYMEAMMEVDPANVHFFDECSVNRTTGNRTYGHSELGKPAFEVQRYSSNATYTVNLLVGYFGIYFKFYGTCDSRHYFNYNTNYV